MGNALDKVKYLKEVAQGLNMNFTTPEGKIMQVMIETMEEMAHIVDDLSLQMEDTFEEEIICGNHLVNIACPYCNEEISITREMVDSDENIEIKCPHCNEDIDIVWECDCEECNE